MKVMGTGSRSMILDPNAKEIYSSLEKRVLELCSEHGDITLISGMAEGWDEAIAKVAVRNDIPLHAYIPNEGYADYYWRRHSQTKRDRMSVYVSLVEQAEEVIVCCPSVYVDGEHSNFVRNRMMIAQADMALVYNSSSRGTAHAVRLLRAQNIPFEEYPFNTQLQINL